MKNYSLDSTDLTWLSSLARALLRDPHAADDLVQDVQLAAFAGPMPTGAPRRAWLAVVARRLAFRRFRSEDRRSEREEAVAASESLPDSTELVERAEVAEQVTAAARSLPEPYRRTILLRFLESRSAEDIAREEGRPVATVRWRIRKGLELLRGELVRKHGRDWSSWCVLLTPLARFGGDVGLATAGTTGGVAGWVASMTAMKSLAAAVVVCCVGIWFAFRSEAGPSENGLARVELETEEVALVEEPVLEVEVPIVDRAEVPEDPIVLEEPEEPVTTIEPASDFPGTVVDEDGDPIEGATVFLYEPGLDGAKGSPLTEVETDRRGRFRFAEDDLAEIEVASCELGALANGFLRKVVPASEMGASDEPLVLVLERGRTLAGRVVDEDGLPASDLELMAYTAYASVTHVSPTQRMMLARRESLKGTDSDFGCSREHTDGRGEITFTGLPDGELNVVSVDPGWTLEDPRLVDAEDTYVIWTAKRRLGVRVIVRDIDGGPPRDVVRATFAFEVTYENGEVRPFEKWVGRGEEEVTFLISEEVLPGFTERVVTRIQFYGTIRTHDDNRTEWRSEVLEDPAGVTGTAIARVELDTRPVPEEPEPEIVEGKSTIELDVRYEDATSFDGILLVAWTPVGRPDDRDSTRATRLGAGRYEVEVPAGPLQLQVRDRYASGSIPAWYEKYEGVAGERGKAFVTLPRGGSVRVLKPEGWTGEWFCHAKFRAVGEEEWRGGLGYSTDEDELRLTVMRSCEWRFELRRDSALSADVVVRTAVVTEGETVVVD